MAKFVIERAMPALAALGEEELATASRKSNTALNALGNDVQWLYSYVTADKMYCLYIAPNEDRVREHASISGFPATSIRRVASTIDPTTGGR